jgi:hypothetical protein
MLPDDALLEIFVSFLDNTANVDLWHTLMYVCRRWRNVVLASPRYLDLQLRCTEKTPVREMLHLWPALPIVISGSGNLLKGTDNIIAALQHHDRICQIVLRGISISLLEKFAAANVMDVRPFPALTSLMLWSDGESAQVVPGSFPVGSAPRLRALWLDFTPFLGLRRLLLSANNHLVILHLWDIPHSGYISPQVMATCLASMTSLESFALGFDPTRSRPNQQSRRLPLPTPATLPALVVLEFMRVSEYLEDLLARVDCPALHSVQITLFLQLILSISQLPRLIGRTEKLKREVSM